jgi:hypothetical protein
MPTAVALILALSACGGGGDAKSGAGEAGDVPGDLPQCSDVWIVGNTLPADYDSPGCNDGDIQSDTSHTPCADEKTRLFVHQTEFGKNTHVAITGTKIQAYTEERYSEAYDVCQPSN